MEEVLCVEDTVYLRSPVDTTWEDHSSQRPSDKLFDHAESLNELRNSAEHSYSTGILRRSSSTGRTFNPILGDAFDEASILPPTGEPSLPSPDTSSDIIPSGAPTFHPSPAPLLMPTIAPSFSQIVVMQIGQVLYL